MAAASALSLPCSTTRLAGALRNKYRGDFAVTPAGYPPAPAAQAPPGSRRTITCKAKSFRQSKRIAEVREQPALCKPYSLDDYWPEEQSEPYLREVQSMINEGEAQAAIEGVLCSKYPRPEVGVSFITQFCIKFFKKQCEGFEGCGACYLASALADLGVDDDAAYDIQKVFDDYIACKFLIRRQKIIASWNV